MTSENDPNLLQELEKAKQAYGSGNFAAAEPLLREIFEKLAEMPQEMAFCTEALSEIYVAWGKFSEAIRLNQRLINVTAPNPAQSLDSIGMALERIASVSLKVGKQEQSEKLTRLAAAVKAGKVDPKTLITEKSKMPNAPPTTEHTYTFRALSADSPPPAGMEGASAGTPTTPSEIPLASPSSAGAGANPPATLANSANKLPSPTAPLANAAPASGNPQSKQDVLGRPIKETAMFSRPSLANIPDAAPAAVPPSSPTPASAAPPAGANAPKIVLNQNLSKGDIPDYQLADFDEEIIVDSPTSSGSHAIVNPRPPAADVQASAPPVEQSQEFDPSGAWGFEESSISEGWGPQEADKEAESRPWGSGSDNAPAAAPHASSAAPSVLPPHSQMAPPPSLELPPPPPPLPPAPPADSIESASSANLASNSKSGMPAIEQSSSFSPESGGIGSSSEHLQSNTTTSARAIRSMSSRTMTPPPMDSGPEMGGLFGSIAQLFVGKRDPNEPVQQLEDPSKTSAQAAGAMLVIAALIVGTFYAAYNFLPRKSSPADAFRIIQHRYASADSTESFSLVDPSNCEFAMGDVKMKAGLRFYLNDWRDIVDMAMGRISQKQYWMILKDDGVVDDNEVKLYVFGGPEAQLANRVDFMDKYANYCFAKDKKYPDRADLNPAVDLHYLNPYTKRKELPTFNHVLVGKGLDAHAADEMRSKFYEALLSGRILRDPKDAHPGEIRCYVVHFLSPRGTIQAFVVQLIGKDGQPVSGVRPRKKYLFALEDGKEYKPVEGGELPFKGEQGLKPVIVWLLMDKLDSGLVFFLLNGPVIVFTVLTFFFLVMSFAVPKGLGRAVAVLLTVASGLPALLFLLTRFMP